MADEVEERDQEGSYRDYIADMLGQLADLAAAQGDRRLATTLRLTAVDVERRIGAGEAKAG